MKKDLENIDNRNFVRTNKLVNGRVKLKAKSYDLIRSISTLVSPTDTDFWTYEVEVKSLGIDYKRAKEYIRDIMRNPIEIKDDVKRTFNCYSWCSSMEYKNGFITFKLDPKMREFMLQIKGNFTKTFEKYILPMESIYAKRIYEMLYQVKKYGYRKFELEELQETLDVPKSLRPYFNFKARVLVIAIKEINKHTDIYIPVDIENLKDNSWIKLQCGKTRKITHLNFEFTLKNTQTDTNISALLQNQNIKRNETEELTSEQKEQLIRDEISQHIDIEIITAGLPASIKKPQMQYLQERLQEFIEWVESVDNEMLNKLKKDWDKSFDRHISGYEKNFKKLDKRI